MQKVTYSVEEKLHHQNLPLEAAAERKFWLFAEMKVLMPGIFIRVYQFLLLKGKTHAAMGQL